MNNNKIKVKHKKKQKKNETKNHKTWKEKK